MIVFPISVNRLLKIFQSDSSYKYSVDNFTSMELIRYWKLTQNIDSFDTKNVFITH